MGRTRGQTVTFAVPSLEAALNVALNSMGHKLGQDSLSGPKSDIHLYQLVTASGATGQRAREHAEKLALEREKDPRVRAAAAARVAAREAAKSD